MNITNHNNKFRADEIIFRYFKIERKDIVFIKAILESYEGMAIVRTLEGHPDIIELLIASDFHSIIEKVLADLQSQVLLREITRPQT